jgi:hypothetical protein
MTLLGVADFGSEMFNSFVVLIAKVEGYLDGKIRICFGKMSS